MNSENPLVPTTVGKRARTEEGAVVTTVNEEKREEAVGPLERKIVSVKRKTTSSTEPLQVNVTQLQTPQIVSVNGNSKVDRCLRCKTFIKKGATHSLAECDARIAKKNGPRPTGAGKLRRKFHMTPKRKRAITDFVRAATTIERTQRVMGRVSKWLKKKESRLNKTSKKLFADLIYAVEAPPDSKKLAANMKKAGL